MIVSVSGHISSGKGTVAEYLVRQRGFKSLSFADTLKDAVAAVFDWPRDMLEGDTSISREWREKVDPWWAKQLNIPDLTPRWVLQQWGTDVIRKNFHDDMWVASLLRRAQGYENIVIPDARFPNELNYIQKHGGKTVVVRRDNPFWLNDAILAAKGDIYAKAYMKQLGVHESEWAWCAHSFDIQIENFGDVDNLFAEIEKKVLTNSKDDVL